MELVSMLMQTGLTNYEAQVYCALLKTDAVTGYEVAKATGISRSNIYLALSGLMEKGGAYRADGETSKYMAVPLAEYCANKRRNFLSLLAEIEKQEPKKIRHTEVYITISGTQNIKDKMRNMIVTAAERVYISQGAAECGIVREELSDAVKRGLRVVVVSEPPFSLAGAELYLTKKTAAQIRLIADSASVLTGTLGSDSSEASCLYTQNQTLVTLFKEALRREIDLITLKGKE